MKIHKALALDAEMGLGISEAAALTPLTPMIFTRGTHTTQGENGGGGVVSVSPFSSSSPSSLRSSSSSFIHPSSSSSFSSLSRSGNTGTAAPRLVSAGGPEGAVVLKRAKQSNGRGSSRSSRSRSVGTLARRFPGSGSAGVIELTLGYQRQTSKVAELDLDFNLNLPGLDLDLDRALALEDAVIFFVFVFFFFFFVSVGSPPPLMDLCNSGAVECK